MKFTHYTKLYEQSNYLVHKWMNHTICVWIIFDNSNLICLVCTELQEGTTE